jgi:subtilisin-like proprotein convertase family protein
MSLLLLAGVWYFWPANERPPAPSATAQPAAQPVAVAVSASTQTQSAARPLVVLHGAMATNDAIARSAASTNRVFFRLTNTTKSLAEMTTSPHAILLENALVDTAAGLTLNIPKQLRAEGEPGAYIVQARGLVNNAFRSLLAGAGAEIVSYIPNNAYLVQVSAGGANALSGNAMVQAVLPYQPYFKVQSSLLGLALKQESLPPGQVLTLGLYANGAPSTMSQIEKMGGKIIGTDRSPFGPVVRVVPPADWLALAQLSGVQRVEPATRRQVANDLARVSLGISVDAVTNANWLGLSGSNVVVEVNDTGIDASHPDFSQSGNAAAGPSGPTRVTGYYPSSTNDVDGHGTHVAGVIAGNGSESYSVTNVPSGSVTNADFRGKAPAAQLFSYGFLGANDTNVPVSDLILQEIPALTNALISNNSWVNGGANEYDLSAASYDAAVRDALPAITGPQPVLFVFPAGNQGGGDDSGYGGSSDTILSPGTAKNVITVGALEQYRGLTNTYTPLGSTNETPAWAGETSSDSQVAYYSSRGNVGVQTEGPYGRFKPDVVAPGTFVVSTRPTGSMWDQAAYYNPTNTRVSTSSGFVDTNTLLSGIVSVPLNAVAVNIFTEPNKASPTDFPTNLPIYVSVNGPASPSNKDLVGAGSVSIPPASGGAITGIGSLQNSSFNYAIGDSTNFPVSLTVVVQVLTTNDNGNLLTVLSNLNETIGPWYYYETGTSIAAPAASGSLALIQDFFTNTLHTTPSPALLKAMLINGARLTSGYNEYAVTNGVNDEGWGEINVPNSVPATLTNLVNVSGSNAMTMFFLDQSPTNALATGDSRTYLVSLPTLEAEINPLHITLAWTDPPGNPAAGIKLVNNLDLVVSNLDNPGEVYYGNVFDSGSTYSAMVDSNTVPDSINNVENVVLPPLLWTNYSVTVIGRNVTANAVTTEQTNVVQDFALVISCGDGNNPDGFTVTPQNPVAASSTAPTVTFVSSYTNGIYFNQLAGANAPWLSTNNIYIDPLSVFGTNADLFVGQTNQWHFYVVTNTTTYTNAAFIIFLPNTLSTPRIGVYADSTLNSTRPEADLNLFVASDPDLNAGQLTNIDLTVISNCVYNVNGDQSALARGGTKFIAYSNSAPGQVYYVGVQCEDQMAAEYGFLSVFSENPFSQLNPDGSQTVNGLLLPMPIPDGNNAHAGVAYVFGLALYPMEIRDVTVTNTIDHQNLSDLVGTLTHASAGVVLNNHNTTGSGPITEIYNDSGQPGTVGTAGPGSLLDFRRKPAIGPWIQTQVDDAQGQVGSITGFTMNIQPHRDLKNGFITVTVPPKSWYYDYVDVPVGYTNILVAATNLPPTSVPPIELYLNYNVQPDFTNYLVRADLTNGLPPGNTISYGPPVNPGTYWVGLYNPDTVAHDVLIGVFLGFDSSAINKVNWDSTGNLPLIDDAVMDDSIFVTNTDIIQGINVGLRVDHERISDLVFTLISPDGTRYLLMENRGGQSTNGAGGSIVVTNIIPVTTNMTMLVTNTTVASGSFDGMAAADYPSGQSIGDWTVAANQVSLVTDPTNAYGGGSNLLALADGTLSYTLPPGITNGTYALTFAYRGPGIVGWWRGEGNANDSIYGNAGTAYGSGYTGSGEVGQAFVFNYSFMGNRVQIPDTANYALTNAFSIEGWFKPTGTGHTGAILWRGDNRGGWDPYFFQMNNDSTLGFYIEDASNTSFGINTASPLTANQWYHVAATLDGVTGKMSIYVNGALAAQTNTTMRPFGPLVSADDPCLGIGNVGTAIWHDVALQGNLDEVSLYARALSTSEIKTIYGAGIAGKYDPVKFGTSAPLSLSEGNVTVSGISTNVFFGDNNNWQTYSVSGPIPTNGTTVTIAGLEPGLLLGAAAVSNVTVMATNVTLTYYVTNVVTNSLYLTFTEDTNLTTTPIKYAVPLFVPDTNSYGASTNFVVWSNSFEQSTLNGTETAGQYFSGGWLVDSGSVDTCPTGTFGSTGYDGGWWLDLNGNNPGQISTNVATIAGQSYILSFAYTRNPGSFPAVPSAQVLVDSNALLTVSPGYTNSWTSLDWQTTSVVFTATSPLTHLSFASLSPSQSGVLLDAISLATNNSSGTTNLGGIYYQPEQSIDPLIGTSAFGNWTLEVLDNRAGATNNANLVSWQLQFTFANTNFTLATITNGFPGAVTNYIPGGGLQWYLVDVPTNADFATNTLIFADLPLNMWWSTNEPPTITNNPPDTRLLTSVTSGSSVLSTNGATANTNLPAFIEPGGHYYLGIQNPNVAGANYAVEVTFHLNLSSAPPTVVTEPATNIVSGAATLQALVTPNSTNTTVYFEYGLDTNLLSGPTASVVLTNNYTTPQWVTNDLTGLAPPGSVWYFRAVGTNNFGTNYGAILTFTNPYAVPPPYAFTAPATLVNGSSAQLNGFATPNGYDAKAWFEIWQDPNVRSSTTPIAVGTNFNVVFVTNYLANAFQTNQAYHYRLVVSNEVGITYGFDHVFNEGNLLAWGSDTRGQTTPIPSGLTNNLVAGIGGGADFSLALKYDGTVTAWGNNLQGQTSVPAGLTNAVAVDGGEQSSLALRSDRTVLVWGSNQDGQANVPPDLTNAVAAAAGGYHCLALRVDGNPVAWGLDGNSQTNIPAGLTNVVEVSAGEYHSVALKNDGTVVAWGNNADGETNVPSGLTNVVAVAAGGYHNLALRSDGTVVAWGFNGNGQTNVPSSLTNVMAIAAGAYHSLALRTDGTVVFWGDSGTGQTNFTPANLTNVFTIAAGGYHNLAVASLYGLNVTNVPPYWTNGFSSSTIIDMDELTVTNINNAALDSNSPPQLVFYSGPTNNPSFVHIDSFSGVITLDPQEIDGPSTNIIVTVATDNGYPPLSSTNIFTLIVNEVNTPPFWTNGVPASTNYTIGVGQLLTVTNTATDSDIPTNTLSYSVTVSPTNSAPAIDPDGIITWTPTVAGTFTLTTIVTDTNPWAVNAQSLSATNYLTVTVTNGTPPFANTNFSITSIVYMNVAGTNGFLLTWFAPSNDLFRVQWTDVLAPANWQTFTNPPFVSYNTNFPASLTNAQFNFFDDGSQSGGFSPTRFYRLLLLQATNTLTLPVQTNFTAGAAAMVIVTNTATDSRSGAVLTYSLVNPPAGAGIDTNGVITWTNASPAGLAARFNTLVTDDSLPPVSATNSFTVFVTPLPAITNVLVTATSVTLSWSAPTNDAFNVRWATNLTPPVAWNVFPDTITSPVTGLFSFTDTNAPALMKFYQLILLP